MQIRGWFKVVVSLFCFTSLTLSSVRAGTQLQSVGYTYSQDEAVSTLVFEPFDDEGGRRELKQIDLTFTGTMSMDVLVENFDAAEYASGEWQVDAYQSALLSFDQTSDYPDGGPFFGLGGISRVGITGDLSAGSGVDNPFEPGTPGTVTVEASLNGNVNASNQIVSDNFDYFITDEPINAKLGPFTELLITPAPGSFFINPRTTAIDMNGVLSMIYTFDLIGDLNEDEVLDALDIDELYENIDGNVFVYDLNDDDTVNQDDVDYLVLNLLGLKYGDSNQDGAFDSSDFVTVFQVGEYEDDIELNSTWSEGDWDGDGDFTTADLVFVFDRGGDQFEAGNAAVAAVPEPIASPWWVLLCCYGWKRRRLAARL